MKRTRGLWASIIVVGLLVGLSLVGFATGALEPKLGLDLQGGVSVILQAPADTDQDVMNQALENIRNRVDAFGVGEPQIAVSGTTIDVQIPGGANGTVEQRAKTQYCLVTKDQTSYGCAPDQATAEAALAELEVVSVPSQVCLNDPDGKQLACYASQSEADLAKSSTTVQPKASAGPSASPSTGQSASPAPTSAGSCIVDSTGQELACYPRRRRLRPRRRGSPPRLPSASTASRLRPRRRRRRPRPRVRRRRRPKATASPSAGRLALRDALTVTLGVLHAQPGRSAGPSLRTLVEGIGGRGARRDHREQGGHRSTAS